jgi:signal transduction histidine kinase
MRAYADAPDVPRALASATKLDAACDRGSAAVLADIEFNAKNGARVGRRIEALRIRALAVASALDAVSVVLTIGAAAFVLRALSRHWDLIRRHNRLLAERADELEKFAGRVAHDIRGPISAATMSLALVRRQPGVDPKIDEISARGLSSLGRASRFIDGLLEFARAGAKTAEDAQAPVGPVIASLVEDLRAFADDAGVKLRGEALPESRVRCDTAILELLLANLVRNAIKYIGDGPERSVTVRAIDHGPRVRFEVEDTGVGVPPELRRSIFEPFVRGPTRGQPGVGLGLATVRRICGAHGCDVGVDDGHKGGSIFWFELPRSTRP